MPVGVYSDQCSERFSLSSHRMITWQTMCIGQRLVSAAASRQMTCTAADDGMVIAALQSNSAEPALDMVVPADDVAVPMWLCLLLM